MVQGDHPAVVGGPLIGADPEQPPHGAGHTHEETAGAAGSVGLADAVGARAGLAVVPALGGAAPASGAEHAGPAEVELVQGRRVPLLTGGLPARLQALVGLAARQTVGAPHVPGPQAVCPGHPGGGEQRLLTGQEADLADRGGT